jgi:hypothetical protein
LLWLAVALMESLGIWVKICADPGYSGTDGFVLVPQDRAVIATWIRAEGIWYAGKTTRAPDLRDFSEIAGHVAAHSVTDDATPAGRLRLLSTEGLDAALRFAGKIAAPEAAGTR